ncbi:hypothetical protein [Sciscionella marina]|uniref:hypothetical protein n=1 Tax=Sciscionella marina TaxID=508770 RepID=UPI001969F7F9|nr:hypothetical protein [Sciscionella marina]
MLTELRSTQAVNSTVRGEHHFSSFLFSFLFVQVGGSFDMPITGEAVSTCCHCEQPGELRVAESDNPVCQECAEESYETCSCCENVTSDGYLSVGYGILCGPCAEHSFHRCDDCDELTEFRTSTNCGEVCDSCRSEWYYECSGCPEWIHRGDDCPDCADDERSDLILDYGYKPRPVLHGEGKLFLGFELEIETPRRGREECAEVAQHYLGRLGYLKEDGSIGCGFEVVTHPMTYKWGLERFPWQLLDDLAQAGCDTEDTGLHVHINRTAFDSPAHVYRWMQLIYRNAGHVIAIARRRSNNWAAFNDDDRHRAKHFAKGDANTSRYSAINTLPSATYELRVFAASLHPRHVQAALGLAAASVEYTRHLSVADIVGRCGWDWPAFASWVADHDVYAPLHHEIQEIQHTEEFACAC